MKYNFLDLKINDLKALFKKTKKDSLVKCLAVDLGLGGVYSEEICLLSGIDKNEKPGKLKEKEINKILSIIKKIISKKINAVIVYKDKEAVDVLPFPLGFYKNFEIKKFKSFNEALDYYFTKEFKEERKEKSAYEKKLEKLERIIEEQKLMIEGMKKGEKENRKKAELIYNNYQLIKEILDEIKKASKKYSWGEIKEKLKGHKIIKDLNTKEKKIVVEIE
jgi:predicted ribosome quality control (RQC) complex YloA/Tae2 family protein